MDNYHKYKFILIASTGRSGSTTMQRLINTIPNSNITGENCGAINSLLICYKNIKETIKNTPKNDNIFLTSEQCETKKIKPSWYNSFNINVIKMNIKKCIIDILSNGKDNRVLGFKEVRYLHNMWVLDIFVELFPNTKIICHYREDLEAQSKSAWWSEKDKPLIKSYTKEIIEYYNAHKNYCYLMTLERMLDIDNVKKLFEFLGEELDVKKYNVIIKNNYADC